MKNLLKLFIESFQGIHGNYLAVLGLSASFFFWYFLPSEEIKISSRWLFIILCTILITILTLINFTRLIIELIDKKIEEINLLKKKLLPKILDTYTDTILDEVSIVLEPSEIFSFESAVGLYCLRGVFEVLFGYGVVSNIQQDKFVQIKIISILPGHEAIFQGLKQRDAALYREIIVKPHFPLSAIPVTATTRG